MDTKTIFSQNLSKILTERDIKKKFFAQQVGVAAPVVSNWLAGNYYPRPSMMARIANALGVHVDELTQEKEETESMEYWRERALASEEKLKQLQPRSLATPEEISKLKEALKVIVDVVAELIDEKANSNRNI